MVPYKNDAPYYIFLMHLGNTRRAELWVGEKLEK